MPSLRAKRYAPFDDLGDIELVSDTQGLAQDVHQLVHHLNLLAVEIGRRDGRSGRGRRRAIRLCVQRSKLLQAGPRFLERVLRLIDGRCNARELMDSSEVRGERTPLVRLRSQSVARWALLHKHLVLWGRVRLSLARLVQSGLYISCVLVAPHAHIG